MSEYSNELKFSGSEIMPTYKAKILNMHIEINYMEEELENFKEAINKIMKKSVYLTIKL